jgi:hypothetical protein
MFVYSFMDGPLYRETRYSSVEYRSGFYGRRAGTLEWKRHIYRAKKITRNRNKTTIKIEMHYSGSDVILKNPNFLEEYKNL